MNWLRKIEDVLDFVRYLSRNRYCFNIRFKKNSNEEDAKEELGESLNKLSSLIIKIIVMIIFQ